LDTMLSLTADPCLVAGPQGVASIDRKTFIEMLSSPNSALESYKFSDDAQVKLLGKEVAVVAYPIHVEMLVDGRSVSLETNDTSTWIRRNGSWQCALHSEAIVGDPFGRDRCAEEET
jgi:hypothetical protein